MKIRDFKEKMKLKYPFSTPFKFVGQSKNELRRKPEKIIVYYLLYSDVHGYFIFDVDYTRKNPKKTIMEWKHFIEDKTEKSGGWWIFVNKILDPLNVRRGLDYTLKDVLAWRINNDLSGDHNQKKSVKHKTKRSRPKQKHDVIRDRQRDDQRPADDDPVF